MKISRNTNTCRTLLTAFFLILLLPSAATAQGRVSIGIHFDPLIGWFGTDNAAVNNDGARPGINAGLSYGYHSQKITHSQQD